MLPKSQKCHQGQVALLLSLVVLAFSSGASAGQEAELAQIKERELESVREQISELKNRMDARAAERDQITAELQDSEVLVAQKRELLKDIERRRALSEKKKANIEAQLEQKTTELEQESRQLGAQVFAAYTSGQQERLKLLLNQHDPATLGRLSTYYRYMSDYRGKNISAVNAHIDELQSLRDAAAQEEQQLTALAEQRYDELGELNAAQEKRQALLANLKTKMAQEGTEISRLAEQEKDLARLIAELTSILSDYPITSEEPFNSLRGKLTWPVAGTLLHDFGQPRSGSSVKWNGVVMAAPRGREVRSIYHGRVVFSDWLAGMGLLVIVDHGDGFLTLYGYNETTQKSAGDWVAPGDVIATVGDSGGQAQTSLYFEVRQGTQAVNPRQWVSKFPNTP